MPTLLAVLLISGGLIVLGGLVAAAVCMFVFSCMGLRDLLGGTKRGH
ncbi:MAG TPA: hypothetical protein VIR56_02845 [Solimonas sp.]